MCDISPQIRNKKGNWTPSILYQHLFEKLGTEQANAIYESIHGDEFLNGFGNWLDPAINLNLDENGEPKIEDVLDFYQLQPTTSPKLFSFAGFVIKKNKYQKKAEESLNAVDKAAEELRQRITNLKRLNVDGKNDETIKQLISLRADLKKQENLIPLLSFAEQEIGPMVEFLSTKTTNDTEFYAFKELNDINKRVQFFENALDPTEFKTNNDDLIERRNNVLGSVNHIKSKLFELFEAKIVDQSKSEFNNELLDKSIDFINKTILPAKEATTIERYGLDSSKGIDFTNKFADYFHLKTENEINQELKYKLERIEKAYNNLHTEFTFIDDAYKMLLQEDDKGNYTGSLVSRVPHTLQKRIQLFKKKALKSKGLTANVTYLTQATAHVDFFVPNNEAVSGEFSEEAEKYYLMYLRDREINKDTMTEEEYDKWDSVHNPIYFHYLLKKFKSGDTSSLVVNALMDFEEAIQAEGKSYIHREFSKEFTDPKWLKIQENEPLKEFYNSYVELAESNWKLLPDKFVTGQPIPKTWIYELKKTLYEEMGDQPLYQLITSKLRNNIISGITEDENYKNYTFTDPYTGIEKYGLFVRNQRGTPISTTDADGKKEVIRSLNLYNTIVTQTALATEFKRKTELEPILVLLSELTKQKHVIDSNGDVIFKPDNNNVNQLKYRTNKALYGKGNVTEGAKLNFSVLTDEEIKLKKTLETKLEETIKNRENLVTLKRSKEAINKVSVEINDIEDKIAKIGKKISYRQIFDTLTEYTRIKGLSFNFVSAFTDVIFGVTTLFHEGIRFGISPINAVKGYINAMRYLVSGKFSKEADKVRTIASIFSIETKLSDFKYGGKIAGKLHIADKIVNRDNLYIMQHISGKINAYATMIAYLMNEKVPGSESSIWNAFDSNGKWKLEIKNPYEGELINDEYIPSYEATKISLKVNDVIASAHGNFDNKKPVEISKDWWGRAFKIFKSWLPNAIESRFGREKVSLHEGVIRKGRYRSIFDRGGFIQDAEGNIDIPRIGRNFLASIGFGNSDLNETDLKNMRSNMLELITALFLWQVCAILVSISAGDDDDEKWAINYLVNQNNRVMKDLTFYFNPINFIEVFKNPFPFVDTVKDAGEVLKLSGKALFDNGYEDVISRGPNKDERKSVRQFEKMIPIYYGFRRSYEFLDHLSHDSKKQKDEERRRRKNKSRASKEKS